MKKIIALFVFSLMLSGLQLHAKEAEPTFREPFTLQLKYSETESTEIEIPRKIPYTDKTDIYLFKGDAFGVNLTEQGGVWIPTYSPDQQSADWWITFEQDPASAKGIGMVMNIDNRLDKTFSVNTVFTVLGIQEMYTLPVAAIEAKKNTVQTWEHPLVQMVVNDIKSV